MDQKVLASLNISGNQSRILSNGSSNYNSTKQFKLPSIIQGIQNGHTDRLSEEMMDSIDHY